MSPSSETQREVRFELLRPVELNAEQKRSPLVFLPVAPLEYHGPHLPVGVDPINATQCALAACRRLGKGVVYPTLYWGTERERPDWMLESLGFNKGDWVVGMDFPTAIWKSHYQPEHLFGLVVSATLEMLISTGYKLIVIVNGHGASNQLETLERLARYFSHTTDALVVWRLALPLEVSEKNQAGHADLVETSLMMYYEKELLPGRKLVDLSALPPSGVPIHYKDFSIVDGPGFSGRPSPDKVTATDPREATVEKGGQLFEETVGMYLQLAEEALRRKKP